MIVLLSSVHQQFPDELIDQLPEHSLMETVQGKRDFNRFCLELRSDSAVVAVFKKYPALCTLAPASANPIILTDETGREILVDGIKHREK